MKKSWYRTHWTDKLIISTWTDRTFSEVDYIINLLKLTGEEKILDLGCGWGRHSIEFAKRGYTVVGIDITKDFINRAIAESYKLDLDIKFHVGNSLDINYTNEFDVVLNLYDGCIGYFENEELNLKFFEKISNSLKVNTGKHFTNLLNASYFDSNPQLQLDWEIGNKSISLIEYKWNKESRYLDHSGHTLEYGKVLNKPKPINKNSSYRLYTQQELEKILLDLGLEIKFFGQAFKKEYSNLQIVPKEICTYSKKI